MVMTPSTNDHQVLASILWHNYWCALIQQSVSVEIEINFCCIWRYVYPAEISLEVGCLQDWQWAHHSQDVLQIAFMHTAHVLQPCHRFSDDNQPIAQRNDVACRTNGCEIPRTTLEFLKYPITESSWHLQRCAPGLQFCSYSSVSMLQCCFPTMIMRQSDHCEYVWLMLWKWLMPIGKCASNPKDRKPVLAVPTRAMCGLSLVILVHLWVSQGWGIHAQHHASRHCYAYRSRIFQAIICLHDRHAHPNPCAG